MDLNSFITKKIDKMRISRGWTVYKLSQETGINAQTIHDWLSRGAVPKIQYLHEVCNAFGITLADFFAEGNLVEVTPKVKSLYDAWCSLSSDEQDSISTIVKNYTSKK